MIYNMKFSFSKQGLMRFISHLDLMRLFMRAMRRAELPIKMTEGFNPHPKFSIARALKLGLESEQEEATVGLSSFIRSDEFCRKLQEQLPEGIKIKNAVLI